MKKIVLLLLACATLASCNKKEPGTVSGKVYCQGDAYSSANFKADTTATVYFSNHKEVAKLNEYAQAAAIVEKIEAYKEGKNLNLAYLEYDKKIEKKGNEETYKRQIEAFDKMIAKANDQLTEFAKDSVEYSKIAEGAMQIFNSIKEDSETVSAKVDNKGHYTAKVPQGEYAAIFVSQQKKSYGVFAPIGAIRLFKVTVNANQETASDAKFEF